MLKRLIEAICFRLVNGPLGTPSPQFFISRLEVKPGDFLVLRFKKRMTKDAADRLRADMKGVLPKDVRILVFDGDVDLSILSPAERLKLVEAA